MDVVKDKDGVWKEKSFLHKAKQKSDSMLGDIADSIVSAWQWLVAFVAGIALFVTTGLFFGIGLLFLPFMLKKGG